jgi:septum formation protein
MPGHSSVQLAEALAYYKARLVHRDHADQIVLGADTIVACGEEILGKADDEAQARQMLSRLSGTRHDVITGLALLVPTPGGRAERLLASDITQVTMRRLSDEEISQYVASSEWRDKAGAYAIQETGDAFIEKLEGSFTNVVGLPMELLERMMAKARELLSERSA